MSTEDVLNESPEQVAAFDREQALARAEAEADAARIKSNRPISKTGAPAQLPEEVGCERCGGTGTVPGPKDAPERLSCLVCQGSGTRRGGIRGTPRPPEAEQVRGSNQALSIPAVVNMRATITVMVGPDEEVQITRQAGIPMGHVWVITGDGKMKKVGPRK